MGLIVHLIDVKQLHVAMMGAFQNRERGWHGSRTTSLKCTEVSVACSTEILGLKNRRKTASYEITVVKESARNPRELFYPRAILLNLSWSTCMLQKEGIKNSH